MKEQLLTSILDHRLNMITLLKLNKEKFTEEEIGSKIADKIFKATRFRENIDTIFAEYREEKSLIMKDIKDLLLSLYGENVDEYLFEKNCERIWDNAKALAENMYFDQKRFDLEKPSTENLENSAVMKFVIYRSITLFPTWRAMTIRKYIKTLYT